MFSLAPVKPFVIIVSSHRKSFVIIVSPHRKSFVIIVSQEQSLWLSCQTAALESRGHEFVFQ